MVAQLVGDKKVEHFFNFSIFRICNTRVKIYKLGKRVKKPFLLLLFLALLLIGSQVNADDSLDKTAQVFSNTLKYVRGIQPDPSGLIVGIIYDPENSSSKEYAESLNKSLLYAAKLGNKKMNPKLIKISDIESSSSFSVAYIAPDMKAYFEKIFQISKQKQIFTVSSDMECVKGKCCILLIKSGSKVEMYLNETTMRELNFEVDAAFKFMVKRI